jgi:hypothetical protein
MPKRYRKTCLDAYTLRRERSQNFDNNNANPNFWANQINDPFVPGLPPLLFDEKWNYASGPWSSVATPKWSNFTGATAQVGFNTLFTGTNIAGEYGSTKITYNIAKAWAVRFVLPNGIGSSTDDDVSVFFNGVGGSGGPNFAVEGGAVTAFMQLNNNTHTVNTNRAVAAGDVFTVTTDGAGNWKVYQNKTVILTTTGSQGTGILQQTLFIEAFTGHNMTCGEFKMWGFPS